MYEEKREQLKLYAKEKKYISSGLGPDRKPDKGELAAPRSQRANIFLNALIGLNCEPGTERSLTIGCFCYHNKGNYQISKLDSHQLIPRVHFIIL